MKKLIEWTESGPVRARRVMLFSIVFSYITLTFLIMVLVALGANLDGFAPFYYAYSGLAGTAVGFYAGTRAKKNQESENLEKEDGVNLHEQTNESIKRQEKEDK